MEIRGQIVDITRRRIFPGCIRVEEGHIAKIREEKKVPEQFILPGFIDSHIHIESSLLVPAEFARLAVVHGTVATVSDPHEIANVLGLDGVKYMLNNAANVPFKFYFGAPACVPATPFETAGAELNIEDLEALLQREDILFLSEMMNAPGVCQRNPHELKKLSVARKYGKQVDGHSPGLRGDSARQYAQAGITADHECVSLDEAREKIGYGMWVQIREGSAARNLEELIPIIDEYPDRVMFCSDDRHPDDLVAGHINEMVRRAVGQGVDLFNVLQAACINPVVHYGLKVGLLQVGDPADFIVVDDLKEFQVSATHLQGMKVAENHRTLLTQQPAEPINQFNCQPKSAADFQVPIQPGLLEVITVTDGQLITGRELLEPSVENGFAVADVDRDLSKLTVVNRYANRPPAVAFIRNFGLQSGALASSVAHDSHNIVSVGTSDEALARAVNLVIQHKGGLCVVTKDEEIVLPLPVAGIMTPADGYDVARLYSHLDQKAKELGSSLMAPFMTLSFMALLVIPELKLSDQGLFDGVNFSFTPLFRESSPNE